MHPSVVNIEPFQPEDYYALPQTVRNYLAEDDYRGCIESYKKADWRAYRLTYLSRGLKVQALVRAPIDIQTATPVLVYNRGGNREFGRLSVCSLIDELEIFDAHHDKIILATQFRGVAGGEGYDEFGGGDVEDVDALLRIARQISIVDHKNIFMAGWSRGGLMTYLALRDGAEVNAAIVVAGPSDLELLKQERPEFDDMFDSMIPNYGASPDGLLRSRSPIYYAKQILVPLLIVHGTNDRAVTIKHAEKMHEELTRLAKPHTMLIYPGAGHNLKNDREDLKIKLAEWFALHSK